MSPAVTILLITIGAGPRDSADPFTPAVTQATREALGPEAHVVSKELDEAPSDDAATELGAEAHADAVVEVQWSEPDHLHTTIRMQRTGTTRWLDRDVGFRSIDEPGERGRTVGFAIASMLPEYTARAEAAAPSPDPTTAAPSRAAQASAAASPQPLPVEPAVERRSTEREQATGAARGRVRHPTSISFVATGALGTGDPASSVGGSFDFRRELFPAFALRLGVGARFGLVPESNIVTRFFEGQLGLAWSAWSSADGRGSIGARVDALLAVAQFAYDSPGSGTVNKEKTLPGGALLLEGGYFFTPELAFVAAAGGEGFFGKTDVFVGTARRTSLGPLHPVAELGLRIGF